MARTVFLGTPEFALPSLAALAAGTQLLAVVAQPDKPSGRGQQLHAPPTARWALEHGIQVLQPAKARDPDFLAALAALAPELAIVAAYGKLLPPALLSLPRLGCINVHASLLPRYRGAAPIQWAIARGETEAGVTLMQMDEGLDTGAMLAKAALPIGPDDTGGSLTAKLAELGGALLGRELPALLAGELRAEPQNPALATLAPKLTRQDGVLDFSAPAASLHDRVRAFQPWPSATLALGGASVKVLRTEVVPGASGAPGEVLAADSLGILLATGQGALRVLELQPEGKRRMSAADFLAGHRLAPGRKL